MQNDVEQAETAESAPTSESESATPKGVQNTNGVDELRVKIGASKENKPAKDNVTDGNGVCTLWRSEFCLATL